MLIFRCVNATFCILCHLDPPTQILQFSISKTGQGPTVTAMSPLNYALAAAELLGVVHILVGLPGDSITIALYRSLLYS